MVWTQIQLEHGLHGLNGFRKIFLQCKKLNPYFLIDKNHLIRVIRVPIFTSIICPHDSPYSS